MKAAIDIGSNSLLLLVTGDDGTVVHDEARVVGLGRGLKDRGVFRHDRMDATVEVLKEYAAIAEKLGVPPAKVRAVATSASRRALNAATFYAQVQKATGLKVEVISGDEEARLTWMGSIAGLELPPGPIMLVDPGGGSTEVILGEGNQIRSRVSLEIGSVRLTELFLGYDMVDAASFGRMRAEVDAAVAPLVIPTPPRSVVAVAGTATTLCAAELGLATYDGARVHGATLTIAALRTWIDRLLEANPTQRRAMLAVSPDRADTLLAGSVILLRILEQARRQAYRVSDKGLRFGAISGR
jgi:exopolyphosphatase/guanosine-5'-triphosphate,3'-diphosphate pyrophosphatase